VQTSNRRSVQLAIDREDYRIAGLAALAIVIHIAEGTLPTLLPGAKPGLANVVTVAALLLYGWRAALWVSLLRVLVGSILIGSFLTPTFVLSLCGSLAAIVVMGLGQMASARTLGPIGYSLLGAMGHMAGQFYAAYFLFIPHPAIFRLLPVLMTLAVGFGLLTGSIVGVMMPRLKTHVATQHSDG
jgi:heptaprenyl diphosphate synthase